MASVRTRTTKSGDTTYSVLFRHDRRQQSLTYVTQKRADEVALMMNTVGIERTLRLLDEEAAGGVDRLTVAELAGQWLAWKTPRVTERTAKDYHRDVDNWVIPWFGDRAAEMVDEGDVQKWVDHMAATLSPKSVADRHMLLHSMYDWGKARSRRLVSHNPCGETELPRKAKKGSPKGTTIPEFRAILDAATRRNQDAHDLILFLGEQGWRFQEATALDVRNVEDDGEDVWVTVAQVFRIDGHYRQVLAVDEAKSQAAFRRIRLLPASAAMVRRRIVGKAPGDLLFTNSRGRHWNQNTFLRETWPRILGDAGLVELEHRGSKPPRMIGDRKPTPHWLRHMHVAVLSAAGVPMQEIQRRIGHESIATTINVYGRLIGDIGDTAMNAAAALMAGERHAPGIAPMVRGEVVVGELA